MTPATNNQFKPLVLVVDDDETVRMIAVEYLSQSGFRVHAAANGTAALASVERISPDLILLDVEMVGMDGFEVCKRLRRQPKHELTPIMMLTGLDNNESIDNAYEVGATDFVTKPINWSLLCHRLRYMFRASKVSEQLAKSKSSLSAAQRIAKIGNWELDYSLQKMEWSEELYRILGLEPGSVEPTIDNLISFVHEDDLSRVKQWLYITDTAEERGSIDHLVVFADGTSRHVRQEIEREFDSDGRVVHVQAVVQDFTERRRAERKIHELAYYDTLTGLANRRLFQDRLDNAIVHAVRKKNNMALLFFDLDNFKRVNDTFGHAIGDQLLKEVSTRIVSKLEMQLKHNEERPRNYTLARMSGDEFTLLIEDSDRDEAMFIAGQIIGTLAESFSYDGHVLSTSLSVGAAVFPEDGDTSVTLIKNADMAMYEAKRSGKNRAMLHNPNSISANLKQAQLVATIKDGLKRGSFKNRYKPVVDIHTGVISSLETMLVLDEHDFESLLMTEYMVGLDKDNVIAKLGETILRSACFDLKNHFMAATPIEKISIGVFAGQFMSSGFIDSISAALAKYELQPQQLELVISEAVLINNTRLTGNVLQALKQLGVRICIDGFGAGRSNLNELKSLPIDSMKIEQAFVNDISINVENTAAARAVVAMGQALGMQVIAGGVESPEQMVFLQQRGCDQALGRIISEPLSSADLLNTWDALEHRVGEVLGVGSGQLRLKSA